MYILFMLFTYVYIVYIYVYISTTICIHRIFLYTILFSKYTFLDNRCTFNVCISLMYTYLIFMLTCVMFLYTFSFYILKPFVATGEGQPCYGGRRA